MEANPELVGYTKGDGEYVLFDHSNLIREYKDRLSFNHARYTELQKDFDIMEEKYATLATFAQTLFITNKKENMENMKNPMPNELKADIEKLAEDHAAEKNELLTKTEQLERLCNRLEQDNKFLQEQVNMNTATDDERSAIIKKWREENGSLRDKIANQEYLEELVEEKKAQLNFLQNQLEQRIKNLYQSEHQRLQAVAETKHIKEENETMGKNAEALKNELLLKQEQADKMQVILCEKEEQLADKQQTINHKLDQLTSVENQLREAKEQNEVLKTEMADSKDLINILQQQLADEQSKADFLLQKFSASKQTLRRLYKEISVFVDEEERSPVITLRPAIHKNKDEEAIIK